MFKYFFLLLCLYGLANTAVAQEARLAQKIQMPAFKAASLRTIFTQLEHQEGFHFSYNSNLLDLDSSIDAKPFKGLLIDYLEGLLGDTFSFKETSSHVIITYAPQRMDVSVDIKSSANKSMVTGYVRDIRTQKAIPNASVYDRVAFSNATLSDQNGFFILDLRKAEQTVAIGLSKAQYRDTAIMLILPIDAIKGPSGKRYGYYKRHGSGRSVFDTYFGGFFTNSAQRIQSLNLAGVFAYSPVQVSLTPGLSTHGFFGSQVVNSFSLNIIGGSTAGVDGTEIAGAFNVTQYDVRGSQFAGLINVVGGDVNGLQVAGAGNVVLHDVKGVQIGGLWNMADTVRGGLQFSAGVNKVKVSEGTQFAGLANIASVKVKNQFAAGFNVAKKVTGVQIAGLVNIADSSDYPIGILNFIKNGRRELALQWDESNLLSLSYRSGGAKLYGLLGFGTYLDDPDLKFATEYGIGANLLRSKQFMLSAELLTRNNYDKNFSSNDGQRFLLRLRPAYAVSKHFSMYLAPSFNYSEATSEKTSNQVDWKLWGANKTQHSFHLGGGLGLSYVF